MTMRRKVLITGAGSGLGRALAQRYAAEGCAVACADIVPERALETATTITGMGHMAFVVDVGSDNGFNALYMAVEQRFGMPDVLVNNAGIASGGPMVETTMTEWHDVIDINLLGVVRGCRAFLPAMLARGNGRILNIASFAGLAGAPWMMSYGVAKAAVYALSEQLRAEVEGSGVTVSVACPSFFHTNLLQNFLGNEQVKASASKMMERSTDSLDAVADRIFAATERGQFLILPTKGDAMRWRMKRWFPDAYFRKLLKATAALRRPARKEPTPAPAPQSEDSSSKQVE
ncbi:MAG TPA: SDR family NAD(P)-dependent oxidoreductase [Xanthomonadaceae bacterium]|jgi:NAD(P)-dependent dehydrogenase (short-subunit alcohol dehydrogenase family)